MRIYEEESFISAGGAHPLHPPPRSAPDFSLARRRKLRFIVFPAGDKLTLLYIMLAFSSILVRQKHWALFEHLSGIFQEN